MDNVLRLFFVTLLLTITLSAYFLVIGALFTERVLKTKNIIQQMPWRSFGLGMVNFLFFGVIALVLLSVSQNAVAFVRGILTIPAFAILIFLAILLSIGLTGMVQSLGEKIFPDMAAWKRNLWSTVILCFACALPLFGWFLLLPYVGFVGIGAAILGFFQRNT
ncbi:MAG: hypothetical protein HZB50_10965 [Chloroflexi bacterium]|nr:hypothetical protein [Chloroflexota bacterium]